jgi:hypothetical protein
MISYCDSCPFLNLELYARLHWHFLFLHYTADCYVSGNTESSKTSEVEISRVSLHVTYKSLKLKVY